MRRYHWLFSTSLSLMVIGTPWAIAQGTHVSEALQHAQAAVAQGKQGYPDALVTQAQGALKHAEQAKKQAANPHLDDAITSLRSAIDHGKQGHAEPAMKAAEEAATHLSQATAMPAEAPQADTGY
jgi:hypothetical protein